MRRICCVALIAQALAGCSSLQTATPPAPVPSGPAEIKYAELSQEAQEVLALLAYYQGLVAMPAEELRREYHAVSQSYARDRSEVNRLRLGLVMSLPGVTWRDDAKLLTLLDGVPSRSATLESPRRQLLLLLQKQAAERLREQRRGDEQQRRGDEQQRRGDEQQRRADELQQKLDAMLNIERSLRRETKKP